MTIVIAANLLPRERGFMNAQTNTADHSENQHEESTFALLIRSEEKSRNVLELAIYPILIVGPLIAIWQFAQQPVNIPPAGSDAGGCVVCADEVQTRRQVRHSEIKG